MANDITVTKNTTSGSERWDVEYTADSSGTVTKTMDTAETILDRDIKVSVTIPSGSATTPATTITSNPTISVNSSTGVITASNSKTQDVTPTVSAGFVTSGTVGTITVSGSNTSNLTTQAAQTIYPSTSDQTIASGKYLTGTQTVKGVLLTNLSAGNIKKDVVVKVGDSADDDRVTSVTGTYEGSGGGGGGGLPVGYTRVPYIEANGSQSCSLGFVPDANTKVECEFSVTSISSSTTSYYIFGCGAFNFSYNNAYFYATGTTIPTIGVDCEIHTVTLTKTSCTLTDPTLPSQTISISAGTPSANLYLFALNNTNKGNARIYSFRVWQSSTLIRDLVPATNSSNVAGFYDLVTNTFYTSATAFIAGKYGVLSWTKIASADFTVNTSNTTAASVGTISCGSSAYTAANLIYVKVRDKAGARNGYLVGTDVFMFNYPKANGATTTTSNHMRCVHRKNSDGTYTSYSSGGTTGYGVYGYSMTSAGVLNVYARYNATYSLTINGTYNVEVYALNYAPNQGDPYNFSFS